MESESKIGPLYTPELNSVDISFHNVSYSVNVELKSQDCAPPCNKQYESKEILRNISGIAKGCEVTAIMGASGAGKTTLLNVIACRVPHSSGESEPGVASGKIMANNEDYTYEQFGDFANYVMQNDVLLPTLTVRETLEYVAALKMNVPVEQRKDAVNQLVKELKL